MKLLQLLKARSKNENLAFGEDIFLIFIGFVILPCMLLTLFFVYRLTQYIMIGKTITEGEAILMIGLFTAIWKLTHSDNVEDKNKVRIKKEGVTYWQVRQVLWFIFYSAYRF